MRFWSAWLVGGAVSIGAGLVVLLARRAWDVGQAALRVSGRLHLAGGRMKRLVDRLMTAVTS